MVHKSLKNAKFSHHHCLLLKYSLLLLDYGTQDRFHLHLHFRRLLHHLELYVAIAGWSPQGLYL